MTLRETEHVDLPTPTGPMRTYLFRPTAPGRYPGLLLYSEIFQVTAPIRRTAALLAGHGFVVAVPEIYHEFEAVGTVLAYDQAGADRGNALKTTKEVAAYDADARAVLGHLRTHAACTGRLGVMGICIGGHLAFRAAMNPEVGAATCFYAKGYRYDPELALACYQLALGLFRQKLGEGDLRAPGGASAPAETKQ